jgi:hypothetical protein
MPALDWHRRGSGGDPEVAKHLGGFLARTARWPWRIQYAELCQVSEYAGRVQTRDRRSRRRTRSVRQDLHD